MAEPKDKIYGSRKQIFINNLIGGLAWAIGATFGLAIILGLMGFIVSKLDIIPVVGTFVAEIWKFVLDKNPQLVK